MGDVDELMQMRAELTMVSKEKDRAMEELKEMRRMAQDVNMKLIESTRKNSQINLELDSTKKSLTEGNRELRAKNEDIEALKIDLTRKEASIQKLNEELINSKIAEAQTRARFQDMEAETRKRKELEEKMRAQTKQFEHARILLEESKIEIASLHQKLEDLESPTRQNGRISSMSQHYHEENLELKEELKRLQAELLVAKDSLGRARQVKSPNEEINYLRNELRSAIEAEENSKRAMDDLAMALKEVAAEANESKEKLNKMQGEFMQAKDEAYKYQSLYHEEKRETEIYRNIVDRLRVEAEESLMAWSGKVTGFVEVIKQIEEEKAILKEENSKLLEALREDEYFYEESRDDNKEMKDILKRSLNEADEAKRQASILRAENSQLIDSLMEKDEKLSYLIQEIECLKKNEVAHIKELKRVYSGAKQLSTGDQVEVDKLKRRNTITAAHPTSTTNKEESDGKKLANLKGLRIPNKHKEDDHHHNHHHHHHHHHHHSRRPTEEFLSDGESEYGDPLEGSIFDVDSPVPSHHHRRRSSSSVFSDTHEVLPTDDHHEFEPRKKKLLRRFGDLLRMKSFYRRDQPLDESPQK